jgi:hypothetical protein
VSKQPTTIPDLFIQKEISCFPPSLFNQWSQLLDKNIDIESISAYPRLEHRNKIHECTFRLPARVHTWQANNYNNHMLLIGLVSIYTMNTINQCWIQTCDTTRGRQRVGWKIQHVSSRMPRLTEPLPNNPLLRVQVERYVSNSSCTCSGRRRRDHLLPCHLNWDQINLLL